MIACNYSTYRSKLKEYCDKVVHGGETVIVTRKDEENVVMISMEDYNYYQKAVNNWHYMLELDQARADVAAGRVTAFSLEDMERMLSEDESEGETEVRKAA